jgi:hypothetical protein
MYETSFERPSIEDLGQLHFQPGPAGLRDLIRTDLLEVDPPRPDGYAWSDLIPDWSHQAVGIFMSAG